MKKFFPVLFLLLLFPVAAAGAGKTIGIPVVAPLSGPLASFGQGVVNGARLKAEELNTNGGINGRPVAIRFEDDRCDPQTAAAVAVRLASDPDVFIVVGHVCSSATLAALPIYRAAGLPAITPASTNPAVGRLSAIYFRNVYQDEFQGAFLARYVSRARHYKRVAILFAANDYGLGLKDAFAAAARRLGLQIVDCESCPAERTDFRAQLAKIRDLNPDAVFLAGYAPQASLIVSQARGLGMKCVFFGADGLDDALMLKNPDAEGLFVTTPFLADRGGAMVRDFVERYRRRFGLEPDWFAANTYDAVGLAAAALARAGCDRGKVSAWLAALDSPGNAYQGIAGPIYFDAHGDCLKPIFVKLVRHGRWVSAADQLQP